MNLIENCKDCVRNTTHTHRIYGFEAKIQLWEKDGNNSHGYVVDIMFKILKKNYWQSNQYLYMLEIKFYYFKILNMKEFKAFALQ